MPGEHKLLWGMVKFFGWLDWNNAKFWVLISQRTAQKVHALLGNVPGTGRQQSLPKVVFILDSSLAVTAPEFAEVTFLHESCGVSIIRTLTVCAQCTLSGEHVLYCAHVYRVQGMWPILYWYIVLYFYEMLTTLTCNINYSCVGVKVTRIRFTKCCGFLQSIIS